MQNKIRGAACFIALSAAFATNLSVSSHAQERTLLKVTLLTNSYRNVLKLYGKPDEIQAGGPNVPNEGIPENLKGNAAQGGFTPGGGGGGKQGRGGGGAPGSFGGGGSPAGAGGAPGSFGGSGGQYAQRQGGGAPGSAGGGGGRLPGFGGNPGGQDAGESGGGQQGAPAGGGNGDEESTREVTWWYHDMQNGLHKSFLFNKDGRVIQVQEYGYDKNHKGGKTKKGVALGSNLSTVLRSYGWSNEGTRSGDNLMMRYGRQFRVAFQMVKNTVVGITIGVGDK